MNTHDIETGMICEGDFVRDQNDYREVSGFSIYSEKADADAAVHFTDGGCMGIDEVDSNNLYLESEVIR